MMKNKNNSKKKITLTEEELELIETGSINIDWNLFKENILK